MAMCMAVGKVSLLLCDMLTWSLGCTRTFPPLPPPSALPTSPPRISTARLATTSFMFMLDCVPLPVCHTTSGKCSLSCSLSTSSVACSMALAMAGSSP